MTLERHNSTIPSNIAGLPASEIADIVEKYVAVARDGEIITDSRLGKNYSWPSADPRKGEQISRPLNEKDRSIFVQAATTTHFNFESFLKANVDQPIEVQVLEVLNHRAFQFNSRTRFRDATHWQKRIANFIRKGRPIEIVIPIFCVINNPIKRLQPTVATAAEDISLLHLGNIVNIIKEVYAPGAIF